MQQSEKANHSISKISANCLHAKIVMKSKSRTLTLQQQPEESTAQLNAEQAFQQTMSKGKKKFFLLQ